MAVHGLGGVGKTRAALEYAWRHDKDDTALLFVSAPTAAELRANLANLAGVLAIESTVTAVDQQVAEVLRWLGAHPGWLLIVDNVDTEEAASEVERLLAKLRAGHVLITSRIANWSPESSRSSCTYWRQPTPRRSCWSGRRTDAGRPTTRPRPPRSPASWAAWPWASNRPGPTSTGCGCRLPSISVAGGRSGPRCSAGTTSG